MPIYVNKYIGLDVACDTAIQRGWLSQANHVMTMTAFNAGELSVLTILSALNLFPIHSRPIRYELQPILQNTV
jgi:hypothetical protein